MFPSHCENYHLVPCYHGCSIFVSLWVHGKLGSFIADDTNLLSLFAKSDFRFQVVKMVAKYGRETNLIGLMYISCKSSIDYQH